MSTSYLHQVKNKVQRHQGSDDQPIRVYLAGRYARRSELRTVAEELRDHGYEVTSRWLFEDASIPEGVLAPQGRALEVAEMDFEDVRCSDMCIAFTEHRDSPQGKGGRHTELGVALALDQDVILIGPREHVFHCISGIKQYTSWEQARQVLLRASSAAAELNAA
jgi:nucleoside 2-deoxyribosyltransferase